MAYDEELAARIRRGLAAAPGVIAERKMFGGLCFLLNGNMVCGVVKSDLMARVGPEAREDALAQPHARPMAFTGRPMKAMVYVGPEGVANHEAVAAWLNRCVDFTATLPPK